MIDTNLSMVVQGGVVRLRHGSPWDKSDGTEVATAYGVFGIETQERRVLHLTAREDNEMAAGIQKTDGEVRKNRERPARHWWVAIYESARTPLVRVPMLFDFSAGSLRRVRTRKSVTVPQVTTADELAPSGMTAARTLDLGRHE